MARALRNLAHKLLIPPDERCDRCAHRRRCAFGSGQHHILIGEVILNGCQEEGCEEEGHEEEGREEEEVTGFLDLARPEGRVGSRRPPLVL